MKKLDIKYFSQHDDSVLQKWRPKICGIACTKMIVDYFKASPISPMDLIGEGIAMAGYDGPQGGWHHEALVKIMRNHKIAAYRQEFRGAKYFPKGNSFLEYENNGSPLLKKGIQKIHESLEDGNPVIVSVSSKFAGTKSNHLVLLTGFAEDDVGLEGVFMHDPNAKIGSKQHIFVELKQFIEGWRKLAIFVDK